MTQRERTMATACGAILACGGAIFAGLWFYRAITSADKDIAEMNKRIEDNGAKIKKVRDSEPMLVRWERLSLPADHKRASREYRAELMEKFRKNDVIDLSFPEEQSSTKSNITRPGNDPATNRPGKVPLWTGVQFQVRFKAKLANLVALIKDLQQLPRMHRIKTMSIERSDEKKEGEMLTVAMSFEALSILDAQKVQDKTGLPDVSAGITGDARGYKTAELIDLALALRKGPLGLGSLSWAASPEGPYKPPLNPPLTGVRNYADIARKNVFMGFLDISGYKDAITSQPVPSEERINLMRFNRFISWADDDGKVEARLWNLLTNHSERLKTSGGFTHFGMLQSGDLKAVVYGTVVKFEGSDIIFRVGLKASDPSSSKWWRYPTTETFFSMHPDDFAKFVKSGDIPSQTDKATVFVVNEPYWQKLISKERIDVYEDGKTFRVRGDYTRGKILFSDSQVCVVQLDGWPLKGPQMPSVSAGRLYPDKDGKEAIYRIQQKHFADLVADKSLVGTKKEVKAGDIDRVFVINARYWDLLTHQRVIKSESAKGTFTFGAQNAELVKGEVITRTDDLVVIRVADKYCHSPGGDDQGKNPPRWHEGFCVLHIDGMVQEALARPLPESRIQEFITPAGADELAANGGKDKQQDQ